MVVSDWYACGGVSDVAPNPRHETECPLCAKQLTIVSSEHSATCECGAVLVECAVCHKCVTAPNIVHDHYCSTCAEDTFTCCECGDVCHTSRTRRRENDTGEYCSACVELCGCCGDVINGEDTVEVAGGDIICEDCADTHCEECSDCGRPVYRNQLMYDEYCRSCARNYLRCDACGDFIFRVDAEECEGDHFCCDCVPQNRIHSFNYKPHPEFHGSGKLFFGIEIEAEGVRCEEDAIAQEEIPDLYYIKHDGSIANGLEIVSHPMSWDFIKSNEQLVFGTFKEMANMGYRSYQTTTCGMHVHVSRAGFRNRLHQWKFCRLFSQFPLEILKASRRRDMEKLCAWAAPAEEEIVHLARILKGKAKRTRYRAVNTCNAGTLEVRIFRGTLAQVGIMANLEYVKAAVDFTYNARLLCSYSEFREFINKNKRSYPHLNTLYEKMVA